MSLEMIHRVRARPDAIVVGVGTVLVDNPRLTARTVTTSRRRTRIRLTELGARHGMLEGGAKLVASFLDAGCLDYAIITVCLHLHAEARTVRYRRSSESRVYDLTHATRPCSATSSSSAY